MFTASYVLRHIKKICFLMILWFITSVTAFAETETTVPYKNISFKSNKDFIVSLRSVLEKDYGPKDLKKALKPFNAEPEGFRAKSRKELFDALPLATNDILISARNLGLLKNTKNLVELQNEVYSSAVKTIASSKFGNKTILSVGGALLGAAVLTGGGKKPSPKSLPYVTIANSSPSIAENGGTSTLTVSLSEAAAADITTTLAFSSTATLATDFSASQTVTISKGATSGTVTVTSIDDSVYEGNETLIATISAIDTTSYAIGSASSTTVSITEDESVPQVQLASSANSVAEEGGAITFTASINQIASTNLAVKVRAIVTRSSVSYTPNIPSDITITVPAGSLSGTATFTPIDNNTYDGTSVVNFIVSSVLGGGAIGNTVTIPSSGTTKVVAITENEVAPTIQLSAVGSSVAENGADITLTATLSGSTHQDVVVSLLGTGTANSGLDYSISDITITAGNTTGTSAFEPIEDSLFEGVTETAAISIVAVSGGGATENGTQSVDISITESDSAPTVTLASSANSVSEGGSSLTLTATLSVASTSAVTVAINTSGSAVEGTDYSTISDITISAGSTSGTASFTVTDDSVYEGTEAATVSIGTVTGSSASAAGSGTSASITLSDNEIAPTVTLSSSSANIFEDGSAITLTATLSNVADEAVTVPINTSGTATEGTDYAAISDITISAGTTTGSTTITPTNDNVSEGAETITVSFGTLSGADATSGNTASLTFSLVDDDVPNIALTSSASSIAEDSGTSLTLTATASTTAIEDIVVTIGTAGTATPGSDYTALPSTLTISAGATTATTSFTPTNDSTYDETSSETAIISVTNVSGGNALEKGDQSVTLTITDDETAPTVTIAASSLAVAEDGGASTLTATLSTATYADVTVALGAAGTASSTTDYSYTSSITISAGSTIGTSTLTATADDIFDAASNETAIISISSVSGGSATESGSQSQTITITDAETAPTVTLAIADATITEGASSKTITATLSGKTYANVAVAISTSGTATEGTDYSTISDIAVSAGSTSGTASFAVTDDSTYEGSETATVSIGSVNGGSASAAGSGTSFNVTLSDNESAPTVSLSANFLTIGEDGSAVTVTATLSGIADEDVTVPLNTSGTAIECTDYATISDITISAGATTGSTKITPTDDSISESNEAIIVSMGTLSGASAGNGSPTSLSFTLTDDESAPSITLISTGTSIAENSGSALTISVTSSIASSEAIVVTLGASGNATSGTDYTALPTTLTIPANATTATTTFTPTNDAFYDASTNETVTLTIEGVSGGGGSARESGDQSIIITITDDEVAPVVTLTSSASSVAENGSSLTLTATLNNATHADVTVTLSSAGADTTILSGSDYSVASSIVIVAGQTSANGIFSPIDDASDPVYEEAENVVVSVSNVNGGSATENGIQSKTITITENESVPTLSLSGTASIDEKTQTATVTANLSIKTDKTVTVSFSNSGTSTANTDYTLSNITIGAGAISGSQTLSPVLDNDFEGGSETVKLTGSASGISGISNSSLITITITNKALNSGTTAEYNSSFATSWASDTEYTNIEAYDSDRAANPNPYESINLNQAFAYGKFGSGKQVAIVDQGFWVTGANASATHADLNAKTIATFGSFNAPGTGCGGAHGTCVAGVIAADYGDGGIIGIAPLASLHLTDWGNTVGFNDMYDKMAQGTADASNAVAQNNSWGISVDANEFQVIVDNNPSSTTLELMSYGLSGSLSSVTAYKNALDDFQNHGVIVFSNGNDTSKTSAHAIASMPLWFTELEDAWISVANIDITGNGTKTYTQMGNPCGLTASFCIAADGTDVTMPSHVSGGTSYHDNSTGTSFSAPMVSGAVALMADHFPNQTPEQWTDRLLASADNAIGYTHIGQVTFGNGVKHGYSAEAGHGIMDIYAALQPITSDAYIAQVAGGNGSLGGSGSFAFNETAILSASSFGDSLANALGGEFTYMYDALDGGFAFDLEQTVKPSLSVSKPVISIDRELGLTRSVSEEKLAFSNSFSQVLEQSGYLNYTRNQSNDSLNSFTSNGLWNSFSDASYVFPFLTAVQGGTGLNYGDSLGNGFLSLSYNSENSNGSYGILKDAYTFSYRTNLAENANLNYVGGFVNEGESFLGSSGGGAFDFSGSDNVTSFFGIKSGFQLDENYFINVGYGLSSTSVNKARNGIVQNISGVMSDSFEFGFTSFDNFGSDMLSFSISQPHRVASGTADLQIAGLAEVDGSIPYTYKTASLRPSGRQLDFAVTYNYDITLTSTFRAKAMLTQEKGHIRGLNSETSIYLGYSKADIIGNDTITIGAVSNSANEMDFKLNYSINW